LEVFIESDANHKLSGLWCQSLIASTCRQQSSTCTEAAGETDVQTDKQRHRTVRMGPQQPRTRRHQVM